MLTQKNNTYKRNYTPIGLEIKKRLLDKGLKNHELAKMIGVEKSYISHIITGNKYGSKHIPKIAEILGIDLAKYVA